MLNTSARGKSHFWSALSLIGLSLSFGPRAHGQTSASAEPEADDGAVQEVIVTSRKRQESLQDIPESITAFDAQALIDARIENFADAISITPSVSMIRDEQPGSSTIAIRGVSQNRSGEPPVAFVVDGVPLGILMNSRRISSTSSASRC